MSRILFIIYILFITASTLTGQVSLFEIQNLSNEYGPAREHHMDSEGDQYYLVWNQWGDIKFRKSENGGLNWGNKITLYSAFDYGGNYPVIAASQDNVYVAYYRNTPGNSQIFLVKSTNGGLSFGNEVQVTNSINLAQVPQIAASGDTVVITYEDRDANWNYQIYMIKSVDGGQTWSLPQNLSNTENHARWCNLVMRDNELYVLWNDQTGATFNDLDLFFTKSSDFGTNWTEPVNITNNGAYNARLSSILLDDTFYVTVSAKIDGLQSDIMLYRSNDLGSTWETPVNLSDNTGNSSRPDIWVSRNFSNNHRIYVVWTDETYHANERAYLRHSNDNGFTWSEMIEFSQNTEDAAWARVVGQAGSSIDQLYLSWYRPHEGTFDYEVWGRRAENQLAQDVNLSGTIRDMDDQPIENATVALNGYVVFSMPDGSYNLDVPAGVYDFSVSAAGFQNFTITQLELNEDMVIDVNMEPLIPGNYPPHVLDAELVDVENILLSWDYPIGFGSMELAYDDGEANGMFWTGSATGNEFMAVAFEHEESFYLRQLKLYSESTQTGENLLVHVLADNGGVPDLNTYYGGPYLVEVENGWTKIPVDLAIPQNIRFYIACQWNSGNTYRIGGDLNDPDGYSYSSSDNGSQWFMHDEMDFMIRAGIAFDGKSGLSELNPQPRQDAVIGYNIYLNGNLFEEQVQGTSYVISEVEVGQSHMVGASAVYDSGESPVRSLQIEVPEPLLFPPLNLRAEVSGTVVVLNWDEPATEGDWIHWDNGINSDAVGGSNIEIFDAAIRFTPTELQAYDGKYLTKVSTYIADTDDIQAFVRVWQGGNQNYAGTLIMQQQLENPQMDSWNTIDLDQAVQIDASQELWIGYRMINPAGVYPAGTDNGPAVPFKGDMLLYGSNWVSMQNQFGWNINWNIQGFVVDDQFKSTPMVNVSLIDEPVIYTGDPETIPSGRNQRSNRWNYEHFNIYRNNQFIGTSPHNNFEFIDEEPLTENTYYVTTAWGNFESVASNEVYVNMVGLDETKLLDSSMDIYPNPAAEHTTLFISIEKDQLVRLEIIDLNGNSTVLLNEQPLAKGTHSFDLDINAIHKFQPGSMIFVRLITEEGILTKSVILIGH